MRGNERKGCTTCKTFITHSGEKANTNKVSSYFVGLIQWWWFPSSNIQIYKYTSTKIILVIFGVWFISVLSAALMAFVYQIICIIHPTTVTQVILIIIINIITFNLNWWNDSDEVNYRQLLLKHANNFAWPCSVYKSLQNCITSAVFDLIRAQQTCSSKSQSYSLMQPDNLPLWKFKGCLLRCIPPAESTFLFIANYPTFLPRAHFSCRQTLTEINKNCSRCETFCSRMKTEMTCRTKF